MSLSFFLKSLTQDLEELGSTIGRLISKALGPDFCITVQQFMLVVRGHLYIT